MTTHAEKMKLITDAHYPLAAKYRPEWMYENKMGCQCLWLAESLSRIMELKPGMRVLDMGCGKALTSIFFAKEFGVTVFATDLWISRARYNTNSSARQGMCFTTARMRGLLAL